MFTKHIPNALTCLNLCSGVVALYCIAHLHEPYWAVWCVVASGIFDFFDGFVARWLKASSSIGQDLDSLADLISFGLVPTAFAWSILGTASNHWSLILLLALPVASALRLAIFNNDTTQSIDFKGLPTPSNALFWIGAFALAQNYQFPKEVLLGIVLLMSALLVAPFRILSLKPNGKGWTLGNRFKALLVGGSIALILGFQIAGFAFVIVLQLLISLIYNFSAPSHDDSTPH